MRKKREYLSPQMKVGEYKLEQQLLTASNEPYGVMETSYGDEYFN